MLDIRKFLLILCFFYITACSKQCIKSSDFGESSEYDNFLLHAQDTSECAFDAESPISGLSEKMQACMAGNWFDVDKLEYQSKKSDMKQVYNLIKEGFINDIVVEDFNRITKIGDISTSEALQKVYCDQFDYNKIGTSEEKKFGDHFKFKDSEEVQNLYLVKNIYNGCGAFCTIECSGLDSSADPTALGTQPEWKRNKEKDNMSYVGITIKNDSNINVQITGKISLNNTEILSTEDVRINFNTPFNIVANGLTLSNGVVNNILYRLAPGTNLKKNDSVNILKKYIMQAKPIEEDVLNITCDSGTGNLGNKESIFHLNINNNKFATQKFFYSALKCITTDGGNINVCNLAFDHKQLFKENSCFKEEIDKKLSSMDTLDSITNIDSFIFNNNSPIFTYVKYIDSDTIDNKNLFFDNVILDEDLTNIKYSIGIRAKENPDTFYLENPENGVAYTLELDNNKINILTQNFGDNKKNIVGYLFNQKANNDTIVINTISKPSKILFKNYITDRKNSCEYLISHNSHAYNLISDDINSKTYTLTLKADFNGWQILKNKEFNKELDGTKMLTDVIINEFNNISITANDLDTISIKLANPDTADSSCMKGLAIQVLPLKEVEVKNSGFLYFYNVNNKINTETSFSQNNISFSIINPNFKAIKKIIKKTTSQGDMTRNVMNNYYEYYSTVENSKEMQNEINIKKEILTTENLYTLEFSPNASYITTLDQANINVLNKGIFVRKGQVIRYDYSSFMEITENGDINIFSKTPEDINKIVNYNYDLINVVKTKPAFLCSSTLGDESVNLNLLCSNVKTIYKAEKDISSCAALNDSKKLMEKARAEAEQADKDKDLASQQAKLQIAQAQEAIYLQESETHLFRDNTCYLIKEVCEDKLPESCYSKYLFEINIKEDSELNCKNDSSKKFKPYLFEYTKFDTGIQLFDLFKILHTNLNSINTALNATHEDCADELQEANFNNLKGFLSEKSTNNKDGNIDVKKIMNDFINQMNGCVSSIESNANMHQIKEIKPSVTNLTTSSDSTAPKDNYPKMYIVNDEKSSVAKLDGTILPNLEDLGKAKTAITNLLTSFTKFKTNNFIDYTETINNNVGGILDIPSDKTSGVEIVISDETKKQMEEMNKNSEGGEAKTQTYTEFKYILQKKLESNCSENGICTIKVKQCFKFDTGFYASDDEDIISTNANYFGSFLQFDNLNNAQVLSLFKQNNKIQSFSIATGIGNLSSFVYNSSSDSTEAELQERLKTLNINLYYDKSDSGTPVNFLYDTGIQATSDSYLEYFYIHEKSFYENLARSKATIVDTAIKNEEIKSFDIRLSNFKDYIINGQNVALFLGFRDNIYKLNDSGVLTSTYGTEEATTVEHVTSMTIDDIKSNNIVWLVGHNNLSVLSNKDDMNTIGRFKFNEKGYLVNKSTLSQGLNFSDSINDDIQKLLKAQEPKQKFANKFSLFFRIIDKNNNMDDNTGSYNVVIRNSVADNGLLSVSWFTRRQYDDNIKFNSIIPDPVSIFNMLINIVLEIMDGKPYGVPKNYAVYRCNDKTKQQLKDSRQVCFYHDTMNNFLNGQICGKDSEEEQDQCFYSCDVLSQNAGAETSGSDAYVKNNCLIIYNNGGILKSLYNNIIQDSLYQFIIKLALITMITLYGFGYFLGLSEFKQSEFMTRIIKVTFIYGLISENGWAIYDQFVISFFKQGIDSIMFIVASSFDIGAVNYAEQSVNMGNYSNKLVIFASGFENLKMLFSEALLYKLLGLAFSGWYGLIYCYLMFTSFVSYVTTFINAIILFLTAQIFTSVTLAIGPLMFILLFYERTKSSFDGWLGILIGYALQQIFIVVTLSVFNVLINDAIKTTFRYSVCMLPLFSITILGFPLSIFHFWKVPGTSFSGSISNPQSQGIPSFYSIMHFYILVNLMSKFLNKMVELGNSFGGGISASTFADPLTKAVSSAGNKINDFAKSVAASPITRTTGAINNKTKEWADKLEKSRVDRNNLVNGANKAGNNAVENAKRDPSTTLGKATKDVEELKTKLRGESGDAASETKAKLRKAEFIRANEEKKVRNDAKAKHYQSNGASEMIKDTKKQENEAEGEKNSLESKKSDFAKKHNTEGDKKKHSEAEAIKMQGQFAKLAKTGSGEEQMRSMGFSNEAITDIKFDNKSEESRKAIQDWLEKPGKTEGDATTGAVIQ